MSAYQSSPPPQWEVLSEHATTDSSDHELEAEEEDIRARRRARDSDAGVERGILKRKDSDRLSEQSAAKRPRFEGGKQPGSSSANARASASGRPPSSVSSSSMAGPSRLPDANRGATASRPPGSTRQEEIAREIAELEAALNLKRSGHRLERARDQRMGGDNESASAPGPSRPRPRPTAVASSPNLSQPASTSTKPRPVLPSRMKVLDFFRKPSSTDSSTRERRSPSKSKPKSTLLPTDADIIEVLSSGEEQAAEASKGILAKRSKVASKGNGARKHTGESKNSARPPSAKTSKQNGAPEIIEIFDSDEEPPTAAVSGPSPSTKVSSNKPSKRDNGQPPATNAAAATSNNSPNHMGHRGDAMDVDPPQIRLASSTQTVLRQKGKERAIGDAPDTEVETIEPTHDHPPVNPPKLSTPSAHTDMAPTTPARSRPSVPESPTSPKRLSTNQQGLNKATLPPSAAIPLPAKHKLQMNIMTASKSDASASRSSSSASPEESDIDGGQGPSPRSEERASSDTDVDMRNLSDALGLAASLSRVLTPPHSPKPKEQFTSPRPSGFSDSKQSAYLNSPQTARKRTVQSGSVLSSGGNASGGPSTLPSKAMGDIDTASNAASTPGSKILHGNNPVDEAVIKNSKFILDKLSRLKKRTTSASTDAPGQSSLLQYRADTPKSNSEDAVVSPARKASSPPTPETPVKAPAIPVTHSPVSLTSPVRPRLEARYASLPKESENAPSTPLTNKSPAENSHQPPPSKSRSNRPLSLSSISQSINDIMSDTPPAAGPSSFLVWPPSSPQSRSSPPKSPGSPDLSRARISPLASPPLQRLSVDVSSTLSATTTLAPSSSAAPDDVMSNFQEKRDQVTLANSGEETTVKAADPPANAVNDPYLLFEGDSHPSNGASDEEAMRETYEVQQALTEDAQTTVSTPASRGPSANPAEDDTTEVPIASEQGSSHLASPQSSRPSTPDNNGVNYGPKTYGGFPATTWKDYRRDLNNFKPDCKYARDLPHALHDHINGMSLYTRMMPAMRDLFEAVMLENTVDDEPEAPPVEIQNDVDQEPTPPWEFYYTNKMWHGEDVPSPDIENLLSCSCKGVCNPKSKTCACLKRQRDAVNDQNLEFAYDKNGKLKIPGHPIFECNDLCGCGDECRNRVIQHGRKVSVAIRKTQRKGWGVFATRKIPEFTFIGIYAGELLTESEAHERGVKYNQWGRTYLFDIDFHHLKDEGDVNWLNKFTVDAYHAGNFTRFLNHSCNPNCRLYPCYINEGNIDKPLLAIFSRRDIEADEEICFNYQGKYPGDDDDDGEDDSVENVASTAQTDLIYVPCECGALNCTGKMFN